MKTIRKNVLLLAFAAGALFLIGNNVFADPTMPEPPPDGQGGGGGYKSCLKPDGTLVAGAYRCDEPGYPTLPRYKCGTPFMIRTGSGLEQCY